MADPTATAPSVLHVDTATEWRGGQVQLVYLLAGLVAAGWPARVACAEGTPLWAALDAHPQVHRHPLPAGRSLTGIASLARTRCDLLAAHTSHAQDLCIGLSKPLVVHRRVDFKPSGGWKYRRPEAWICVSQAVADIVAQAGGFETHVVFDGVEALPQQPPAADGPTVLAVGARVAHKGHRVLADAARLLPDVDIGVAGEGKLVYDGLRWLGQRSDVAALHAAARVFVHPSVEEGMGQAVVEAMLAGVPVVCSDAGGLPEVVGDTGIVVARGDAAALADGIRRALAGDHPPVGLAVERARRLFSVASMVRGSMAVYTQVAAAGRRR